MFIGQKRPENEERLVKIHYSDICKSELRRSDRRAAMSVENILFKTKKLQMKTALLLSFTGDNTKLLRLRGFHHELSLVVCGFLIPILAFCSAPANKLELERYDELFFWSKMTLQQVL